MIPTMISTAISTRHGQSRHETAARRMATLALVGGILCSDPDDAVAAPAQSSAPPTSGEPLNGLHESDEAAPGLPRVLVYGAVAGLFLFVAAAAGAGAHRKH